MSGSHSEETVSLTLFQKARLAVDAVPSLFFIVALVLYVTVLKDLYGGVKPALVVFLAAVALFTGYDSLERVRDLISGVAFVRQDVLQRIGRTGRSRGRRYAMFTSLGRLWIRGPGVAQSRTGHPHRVTYSPASRIAWSFEPLP